MRVRASNQFMTARKARREETKRMEKDRRQSIAMEMKTFRPRIYEGRPNYLASTWGWLLFYARVRDPTKRSKTIQKVISCTLYIFRTSCWNNKVLRVVLWSHGCTFGVENTCSFTCPWSRLLTFRSRNWRLLALKYCDFFSENGALFSREKTSLNTAVIQKHPIK